MKKIAATALIAATLLASAAPVGALVVTDPGAYTRMLMQVDEMKKANTQITQQLDVLTQTQRTLTGTYRRGVGIVRSLQNMNEAARNLSAGFFKISMPGVSIGDPTDIKELQKFYGALFPAGNSDADAAPAEMTAPMREEYQQRSIKSAMESAEFYISNIQNTWAEMNDLAAEIDRTENMKDATDLGNRFLAELIRQQIQTNLLLAQLTRAETTLKYKGASDIEPVMKSERAEDRTYSGFGKKQEDGVVRMRPEHLKGMKKGHDFFDGGDL